ncbi:unnamed protein product [Chrysoparadoxa australica]
MLSTYGQERWVRRHRPDSNRTEVGGRHWRQTLQNHTDSSTSSSRVGEATTKERNLSGWKGSKDKHREAAKQTGRHKVGIRSRCPLSVSTDSDCDICSDGQTYFSECETPIAMQTGKPFSFEGFGCQELSVVGCLHDLSAAGCLPVPCPPAALAPFAEREPTPDEDSCSEDLLPPSPTPGLWRRRSFIGPVTAATTTSS